MYSLKVFNEKATQVLTDQKLQTNKIMQKNFFPPQNQYLSLTKTEEFVLANFWLNQVSSSFGEVPPFTLVRVLILHNKNTQK